MTLLAPVAAHRPADRRAGQATSAPEP